MPPRTRSPEEVQKEKDRIFNAALAILTKEGFESLSMRRVANACKISSTKIYSYFENKDHIYFSVMENSFINLRRKMEEAYLKGSTPEERLVNVIDAIFDYAISKPHQYELILSRTLPKCSDRNTEIEYIYTERESGIVFYNFWSKTVSEYYVSVKAPYSPLTSAMHLSTLHGSIMFNLSRNLQEVDVDINELRPYIIQSILQAK